MLIPLWSQRPMRYGDLKASTYLLAMTGSVPPRIPVQNVSVSLASSLQKMQNSHVYFLQLGVYPRVEDAEQQRARLAMKGFTSLVTEREENGRTVYRVRIGPFNDREEADRMQYRVQAEILTRCLCELKINCLRVVLIN